MLKHKATHRKFISILLVLGIVVSFAVTTYAEENEGVKIDTARQLQDIDQQLQEIEATDTFSPEQKESAQKKAVLLKRLLTGQPVAMPRASSQYNRVPYYKQETNWYCAAATIQQTLGHYYYSPMPSQASIMTATANGDTNAMRNYLNGRLNPSSDPTYINYSVWWNGGNMQNTIVSIASSGTPIVLHVKPLPSSVVGRTSYTDTTKWPYKNPNSGHYMSISGFANSGAQVEVTDPFIMWTDAGKSDPRYQDGKYMIDFSPLNTVGDRLIL